MQFRQLLDTFELPLLKRELVEAAQRRRTYVLRVLLTLVLSLIFIVFWMQMNSRHNNVLRMLGHGRELAVTLIFTDLIAIYALLPAMACSAISGEREKQTLPLLLIARLQPRGIVLEKFVSRLIPMLGLLLITTPLLAMTYVVGGMTQADLVILVLVLLTAAIQAASCAVFCSSLCATGIAAFWSTYALLAALALGPPLLYVLELTPDLRWVDRLPGNQQAVPFTMFILLVDRIWNRQLAVSDVGLACFPVWMMSIVLLVAARFALVRIGAGPGLTGRGAKTLLKKLRNTGFRALSFAWSLPRRIATRWTLRRIRQDAWNASGDSAAPFAGGALPIDRPIAWRETRGALLASWSGQLGCVCVFGLIQLALLETKFSARWDREGLCIFVDAVVIIVGLLLMVGQSCHGFASERGRQTLDVLLTVPVSNVELLKQKQRAVIRLQYLLLIPLTAAMLIHLFYVDLRWRWHRPLNSSGYLDLFSSAWWSAAALLTVTVWSHALVYLSLARWTGTLFGLLFRSQMKAMVGTMISLLILCFAPALLVGVVMIAVRATPGDMPLFFFSTPIFIYGFALSSELDNVYRNSWFPDSDWLVVLFNLAIYGGLLLVLRWQVLRWLPWLLNRLDVDDSRRSPAPGGDRDSMETIASSVAEIAATHRRGAPPGKSLPEGGSGVCGRQ